MTSPIEDIEGTGPYILWVDYGPEGWAPVRRFDTAEDGVLGQMRGPWSGPWLIAKYVEIGEKEGQIRAIAPPRFLRGQLVRHRLSNSLHRWSSLFSDSAADGYDPILLDGKPVYLTDANTLTTEAPDESLRS